jgi:hypothetical protein
MIAPRFVAIDTSVLASWAKAASSRDSTDRARSHHTLESLLNRGWIPVLTIHHFIELIRHPDLRLVSNRIKFLKSLPQVAWICNLLEQDHLGSVVDVFDAEVRTILDNPDVTIPVLKTSVRHEVLRFGSGSNIATLDLWQDFRPVVLKHIVREQEIASLVHVSPTNHAAIPISVLKRRQLPDRRILHLLHAAEAATVASQLTHRGDIRIRDPFKVALEFEAKLQTQLARIVDQTTSSLDAFLQQFDISRSDIRDSTTLAEFEQLAQRRQHVRATSTRLGLDLDTIWVKTRHASIPSDTVIAAIRRSRSSAPRASGSDITDDYLAAIGPYLDAIIVDKRTNEFLTQAARRDESLRCMIGFFARVKSYDKLPQTLAN